MSYNTIVSHTIVATTAEALQKRGYSADIAGTKTEALERIKISIPRGASVMNGTSLTLEQIGYLDYLKLDTHGWIDLHKKVIGENDPAKRSVLRKQAELSDYYLGSVHALTENGEFIVASNTGSQLPHIVFTSPNLIFIVGAQKIVPTLTDGMKRLEEYVFPLEDDHMKRLYGRGTNINKIVIFKGELSALKRTIRFILVEQPLGF